MKVFLLISALLAVATAQEPVGLTCDYFWSFETYRCELRVNNPNGLDDFTEIGGIHLEGFSNANVTFIYRISGSTPNIPRIICNTFPNLERVMFFNSGLQELTDSSFAGCSQITNLDLEFNRISSITADAFASLRNLTRIYLDSNMLTALPETLFANQQELTFLDLNNNPLGSIPTGLFRPLEKLEDLFLGFTQLEAINSEWFSSNSVLDYLNLAGNRIVLTADSFVGLSQLTGLNLADNGIEDIPAGTFAPLENLQYLYMYSNNLVELEADSFPNLRNLILLNIGDSQTVAIRDGAFRGLTNLTTLTMSGSRLRELSANSFEGLENLEFLQMNTNQIEELPPGVFVPLQNIATIGLWNNRIKTLRRNAFGNLATLTTLDLEANIVNAIDREIIDEAVALNTLYLSGNLCASNYFGNFLLSRNQYLPMLQTCFANMRFIVDTTTEANGRYSFFDGPQPGIVFRVNTDSEVQIALTPFNFEWSPMLEIFIGSNNNTRSVIRMNQENTVVSVPTPQVLARNQWNDFRVTWANQVVLVYRGNDIFPFMGFTMREFFPVNFYGLRAADAEALWSVQPVDASPEEPDTNLLA